MPLYDYECFQCGNIIEVVHGMHEKPDIECEACGNVAMTKVILQAPAGFISTPKTLGALIDKNTSRMSDDEKEMLARKTPGYKPKKKPPKRFYDKYLTKTNEEVVKMTPEQRAKYIKEG
jgi:putative FmdB family regulatory protein